MTFSNRQSVCSSLWRHYSIPNHNEDKNLSSVGFTLIAAQDFREPAPQAHQHCHIACLLSWLKDPQLRPPIIGTASTVIAAAATKTPADCPSFYLRYSTTAVVMSHNIVVKPGRVPWQDHRQSPGELVSTEVMDAYQEVPTKEEQPLQEPKNKRKKFKLVPRSFPQIVAVTISKPFSLLGLLPKP